MEKRIYTRPELSTTSIDNEISLIMMTDWETPPDKPTGPPSATQQSGESSPTQQNNFNDNPFGE
ncbi:hypothetical protein [Labilibacter marinus]|uniref:hypothetical protein n=1 Tax=Labilibacter marinus TaxID=1477105 RepID=UPI00083235F4|nr:hypothetical protein [Labilibacter marinus]